MWQVQSIFMATLSVLLFGVKLFALIDCFVRDSAAFTRVETIAKQGWLVILGIAIAAHLVQPGPIQLLNLAGTVASLVYLAQLRGSSHR